MREVAESRAAINWDDIFKIISVAVVIAAVCSRLLGGATGFIVGIILGWRSL